MCPSLGRCLLSVTLFPTNKTFCVIWIRGCREKSESWGTSRCKCWTTHSLSCSCLNKLHTSSNRHYSCDFSHSHLFLSQVLLYFIPNPLNWHWYICLVGTQAISFQKKSIKYAAWDPDGTVAYIHVLLSNTDTYVTISWPTKKQQQNQHGNIAF